MTDDLQDRVTGDRTYKDRVARYQYVVGRRSEKPQPTLDQIGKELGITKQNVSRLLSRGTVRPSGRQPSNEGRKKVLRERLDKWQARKARKVADGIATDREDGWITYLSEKLDDLS